MITQKKKKHMQSQFQKHRNNIRKTWQLLKNLLGKLVTNSVQHLFSIMAIFSISSLKLLIVLTIISPQ